MKIKSWDGWTNINDGTQFVSAITNVPGFPDVEYAMTSRPGAMPRLGSMTVKNELYALLVTIEDMANLSAWQAELSRYFDPRDNTSKQLVVTDDDGASNERYVMARPQSMRPVPNMGRIMWVIYLMSDGVDDRDGRFRRTSLSTDTENITSSGETWVVTNNGEDDAYPVITIKPTTLKTDQYAYRRWCPVRWNVDLPAKDYPVDIANASLNTASLISGGKLRSDGNDLIAEMQSGKQLNRWFGNWNTSSTRVWVNMDFQPRAEAYLAVSIDSVSNITEISIKPVDPINPETGAENYGHILARFPNSGVVVIGSEAFTYSGKDTKNGLFLNVTRAVRTTTKAAHAVDDDIWWAQNPLWLKYGKSSASGPVNIDLTMPIFNLDTSTNASWVYANFYHELTPQRAGSWRFMNSVSWAEKYSTHHYGTPANLFAEMGARLSFSQYAFQLWGGIQMEAGWWLHNPCGIQAINVTDGEKYEAASDRLADWQGVIMSSMNPNNPNGGWYDEYTFSGPSVIQTWESWTRNETLRQLDNGDGTQYPHYVAVVVRQYNWYNPEGVGAPLPVDARIEVDDCTITLDSTGIPIVTLGSENGGYSLNASIENVTTGESITVKMLMAINEELEVDTDEKTVTYLVDNSSQLAALTLDGGARKDWLPLQVGNNTLKYTETGVIAVTVDLEWRERFYD